MAVNGASSSAAIGTTEIRVGAGERLNNVNPTFNTTHYRYAALGEGDFSWVAGATPLTRHGVPGGAVHGFSQVSDRLWKVVTFPYPSSPWTVQDPVAGDDQVNDATAVDGILTTGAAAVLSKTPGTSGITLGLTTANATTAYLRELWVLQPLSAA